MANMTTINGFENWHGKSLPFVPGPGPAAESASNGIALLPRVSKEQVELTELESILAAKQRPFHERGKALQCIKAKRLYRQTHETFEAYCRDRRDTGRHRAAQLIEAFKIYDHLVTIVTIPQLPSNEAQVRPFKKLS